jgi:hypothetical protein
MESDRDHVEQFVVTTEHETMDPLVEKLAGPSELTLTCFSFRHEWLLLVQDQDQRFQIAVLECSLADFYAFAGSNNSTTDLWNFKKKQNGRESTHPSGSQQVSRSFFLYS